MSILLKHNKVTLLAIAFCISQFHRAQTILTGNIGENYMITAPGVYQVQGTVVGNITVSPTTLGDIVIEGVGNNPILQGVPWSDTSKRSVSHYAGNAKGGTLIWRNLTIRGNSHNALEGYDTTPKVYQNLHVINYARTEDGISYPDVGSINGGENSTIRNCYLETGDDAAKLTEQNSYCYNTRIRLTRNGSGIQLGWSNRMNGPNHIGDTIEIRGQLTPNIQTQDNESTNPGRCIISGIVQNTASNVSLTNLDIDVTNYKNLIKILVQSGTEINPTLSDVLIRGKITDSSIFNNSPMKAVSLVALNASKIRNMVIDMGDKIAQTQFHYIKGDVDVKFKKSDGTYVTYIGGILQTTGIKDIQSTIITSFPNPFKDILSVITTDKNVFVCDVTGRIVNVKKSVNEDLVQFHTSSLSSGVYFLKTEKGFAKVIKQ